MVLYGINLAPLDMELMDADPTILPPLYTNDAAFDGSEQLSAAHLQLLMYRDPDQG